MEEIDLFCTTDYPMPPSIVNEDYDSERDILILKDLPSNNTLSFAETESLHFDILLFSRPPAKPPDGDTGILNIKMMGDIYGQKALIHKLMITLAPHQEKSPNLLSYRGLKAFPPFAECPMMIHGKNNPILDVLIELKCKALADLGASINLMPLSVWKKLGLPDFIPTRMTLELANRAICTLDGIASDVFVPVGKFTFLADFVVVDYASDPRVPLILGRPFLRTARVLIDVHGEEMILCDGDERLTLNMKHDIASYSNHPHRESANLINIFNVSSEDCLEDSVSNQTKGCNFLSEELPDIDSFNDIHPYFDDNPLSGSTTYSSNSLLEEFTDELALITYPPNYDNLQFDIESDLKEIDFLLYQGKDSSLQDSIDQMDLANLDAYFVDPTPEMFTDEHAPDYSSPPRFDVYDDDFLEVESDADNFYDDPFDSKGEKIKESKLLIDELDLPCDFLLYSEYDSFNSQDFSRVDDFPSPNNEEKVFNPGILIQEKSVTVITRVAKEKKLAISKSSLVFEEFDPLFYEPLVFKDVPKSMRLSCFQNQPDFHKPDEDFYVQCGKNTPLLDVLLFHFYPP
nr:reverse transcriptase domain-containing protein [Tanacetum cinerariifolium]